MFPSILPIRIIEQLLQALAERRREAGGPGCIEEADTDHVPEMCPVLVAPGDELHAHDSGE
jgi:hypothetical protein